MQTRYTLTLTLCFLFFSIDGVCQHFGETSVSYDAIFIDQNGKAYVWGSNQDNFPLGIGDFGQTVRTPIVVDSAHRWITGSVNFHNGAFISSDSTLYFTGASYLPTYFGTDTLFYPTPYPNPAGVTGWQSVSLFRHQSRIALTTDGKAYYWDNNKNPDLTLLEFPTNVKRWVKVATGNNYYLLLSSDGRIYGFGENDYGQLGTGDAEYKPKPTMVYHPIGLNEWTTVAAGSYYGFSIGIDDKGRLFHWGRLYTNDKIVDTGSYVPLQYASDEIWKDVKISFEGTVIGLTIDGKIYMWGGSDSVLLGLNDGRRYLKEPALLPFPIGVTSWKDISICLNAAYALDQDCNVWGWGYNDHYYSIGLPLDSGQRFPSPQMIKSFCQQNDVPRYKSEQNFTDMSVYPNPTSKNVTAEFILTNSEVIDIELLDVLGRKVQTFSRSRYEAGKRAITLNISDLTTGKYILRIQAGGQTASTSVVVQ